jgi:formate hydrogenlyase subunit 3/multisubunit Na+/H+ antiporter MnhD subunit
MMGYTALYNLGCILTILGMGGRSAVILILVSLAVRSLALALIAAGMSTLYLRVAGDGFAQVEGIAHHMPIATFGVLLGGITLAGAPFTAGFAPYWQLLRSVAEVDSRWLVLFILGGLGVTIGYLRGFYATLFPGRSAGRRGGGGGTSLDLQEPISLAILISMLSLACILLGLVPSLLIEPLQTISNQISFITR